MDVLGITPEMFTMKNILGVMTLVSALTMVVIGLPSQIIKNRRDKVGLSIPLVILICLVYGSRSGYAMTIGSFYILVPDVIGFLLSLVMLVQSFVYNK